MTPSPPENQTTLSIGIMAWNEEDAIRPMLTAFGAEQLRDWAKGLGVDTFIGSSNRVFPSDLKAAPLLRGWLRRLREAGVHFHLRHRWTGWTEDGALRFDSAHGEVIAEADAVVLALGGGSWRRLGSDGRWTATLAARGIDLATLQPSNCGFECGWSAVMRERTAGQPIKPVAARLAPAQGGDGVFHQGEFIFTSVGVEGSLIVQEVKRRKGNDGYNVATGEYEDLVKAGVVDPKKVTRSALQNASSISGLMLTTECLITEIPEKKEKPAADPHHGGGGMDY